MNKMKFFIFILSIFSVHPSIFKNNIHQLKVQFKRNYSPYGQKYYENYLRNLNSKNITIQNNAILKKTKTEELEASDKYNSRKKSTIMENEYYDVFGNGVRFENSKSKKSENFEIVQNHDFSFKNIGGYDNIKKELSQCIDILNNYKKYEMFNVRIPKGVILEGPPGNGKTMIAKGFAGETNTSFIAVSGSQFQEKYVGVGQTRVRELFKLAKENSPCVIFIDEIDAIGRARSSDGESSSSERDNTLNELLVNLDGFKTSQGLFLIGATNRIDLLDPALLRPGRIDKKIFIGLPDSVTRESILSIHLEGKPYNKNTIYIKDLVDLTAGLSGAQIENLLNEAMLNSLRNNNAIMEYKDIDIVMNKIMVGWQPTEHQFTADIIERIAIHEMGHAIVGFFSKHHSKVSKVIINLSAPKSPGYTMFESSTSTIFTREALFEHLMILLAGRIAEEIFYDVSVTTGAINDFEEAFKLAEKMIIYYGMGKNIIYPNLSDKYKEKIDDEVVGLINDAYHMSKIILEGSKDLISECAIILKNEKILKADQLVEIIQNKYKHLL
jgi:cell division protease FtsH